MKFFVCGVLCCCLVWLPALTFGREIAPIEWEMRDPQRVWGNYEASGMCRFTYFQTYHPGEVKLNVTFNKILTSFNDYDSWQRLETRPGIWYYSQSISWINPGFVEKIEFRVRWSIFSGRERPDGVCTSNVGTATNRLIFDLSIVPAGADVPTTAAPIIIPATEAPIVTPTTPSTTVTTSFATPTTPSTAPTTNSATTTTVPTQSPVFQGCTISSTHTNIWTTTSYKTTGYCFFHFNVLNIDPSGTLNVNVTFDKPIENFHDFGLVNPVMSRPGHWYYGRTGSDLNFNPSFDYAFEVEWKDGDVPQATCDIDFDGLCPLASITEQPITNTEEVGEGVENDDDNDDDEDDDDDGDDDGEIDDDDK